MKKLYVYPLSESVMDGVAITLKPHDGYIATINASDDEPEAQNGGLTFLRNGKRSDACKSEEADLFLELLSTYLNFSKNRKWEDVDEAAQSVMAGFGFIKGTFGLIDASNH
jgi:hypothetical protein